MKAWKLIGLVAVAGLLAACTNVWLTRIDEVRNMDVPGTAFDKALHAAYVDRASVEAAEGDHDSANRFVDKARLVAQGVEVLPEDPHNWSVPGYAAGELDRAHVRLVNALLNLGAREKMPDLAARAQVMFDCWVEEWSENFQPDDISFCRTEFMKAMAELEDALKPKPVAEEPPPPPAPAPPPPAPAVEPPARDYLVFFDWDRFNIRADAASILERVVEAVRALNATRVVLVGHADRSGPSSYNQRLSERRASSVEDFLSARGVSATGITTEGRGEDDPRVPTPDGVREQENRRVEIRLE